VNRLLVMLLLLPVASCQEGKKRTESAEDRTFAAERSAFFNSVLTPAETARQLQSTTAAFHPELMNDPRIFSSYATNEVKAAANMGIYLADLNYSVAYSQPAFTKQYFEAAYQLSKLTGIEERVLSFLKARYEAHLAENDSVRAVMDDLLTKATRGLQGTQKERLAGIAMAAYQVENLHLAVGVLDFYVHDTTRTELLAPLSKMIVRQQANVETIYHFVNTYSDPLDPDKNPNYPYYAASLLDLMAVYEKLTAQGITRSEGDLSDSIRQELLLKVNSIRVRIVAIE
jgi:hypothetical protein